MDDTVSAASIPITTAFDHLGLDQLLVTTTVEGANSRVRGAPRPAAAAA